MKKARPSSPAPDRLSIVLQDRMRLFTRRRPRSRSKPFRERDQAEPLPGVVDPEESQRQPQTFLVGRPSKLLHGEPSLGYEFALPPSSGRQVREFAARRRDWEDQNGTQGLDIFPQGIFINREVNFFVMLPRAQGAALDPKDFGPLAHEKRSNGGRSRTLRIRPLSSNFSSGEIAT
jgi:hypothetical protein